MARSSIFSGLPILRLELVGVVQLSLHVIKIKFDTLRAPDGKNRPQRSIIRTDNLWKI